MKGQSSGHLLRSGGNLGGRSDSRAADLWGRPPGSGHPLPFNFGPWVTRNSISNCYLFWLPASCDLPPRSGLWCAEEDRNVWMRRLKPGLWRLRTETTKLTWLPLGERDTLWASGGWARLRSLETIPGGEQSWGKGGPVIFQSEFSECRVGKRKKR